MTFEGDGQSAVSVVRLSDLSQSGSWHGDLHVAVDVTGEPPLPLPVLARIVVLRRRLRATGGDLHILATAETAAALRRVGLHWVRTGRHEHAAANSAR